jgi:hypothetical protein
MPITVYYVTLPDQTHPCHLPDRFEQRFTDIMLATLGYVHVRLRSSDGQRERTFLPLGVVVSEGDGNRLVAAVVADPEFRNWPFSVRTYHYDEFDEIRAIYPPA